MRKQKTPAILPTNQTLLASPIDPSNPNPPPRPPDYLDADAKWKWDETWPRLDHAAFILDRDQDVLILYCNAYSIWREALRKLEAMDALVKDVHNSVAANPYIAIRDTAAERLAELGRHLGLAPNSAIVQVSPWSDVAALFFGGDDGV